MRAVRVKGEYLSPPPSILRQSHRDAGTPATLPVAHLPRHQRGVCVDGIYLHTPDVCMGKMCECACSMYTDSTRTLNIFKVPIDDCTHTPTHLTAHASCVDS